MYKLLGGLKDYFKHQEIQTDNAVFRLHNVFTTVLLLTCSLIITATQYVGQPISCIVNGFVAFFFFLLLPPAATQCSPILFLQTAVLHVSCSTSLFTFFLPNSYRLRFHISGLSASKKRPSSWSSSDYQNVTSIDDRISI